MGKRGRMESINIGLLSDDEAYAKALINGLNQTHPFFIMSCFKEEDELPELDILILDQGMSLEKETDSCLVNLAVEGDCKSPDIYRYDGAKRIGQALIHAYVDHTGRGLAAIGLAGPKHISLISSRGGTGVSRIADQLAAEIRDSDRGRALIIEASSYGYKGSLEASPIRNFIYYVLTGRKEYSSALAAYISNPDGPGYLNYGRDKNPLAKLNRDQAREFMSAVRSYSDKEYILFDIGDDLSEFSQQAIEQADLLVRIEDGRGLFDQDQRQERMEEIWNKALKQEAGKKSKIIVNCLNMIDQDEYKRRLFARGLAQDEKELVFIPENGFKRGIEDLLEKLEENTN